MRPNSSSTPPRARNKHNWVEPRGGSGCFVDIQLRLAGVNAGLPTLLDARVSFRGPRSEVRPTTVLVLRGLRPARVDLLEMGFMRTLPYDGGGAGTGQGIGAVLEHMPLGSTHPCHARHYPRYWPMPIPYMLNHQ
jgi:hypothetical protein